MVEHSAVNRNVGGSNPPRGANSFVIQPVADIFRKFGHSTIRCRCANDDQSRSIKTNENQLRQVSLRFVRSIAANRDQTKHSARDRMLGLTYSPRSIRATVVQIHSPRPFLLEKELTANEGAEEHLAPHQEVDSSNPLVPTIISLSNSYRYAAFC